MPDSILLKPGILTTAEFEIIKTHTILGAKTLIQARDQYPNNDFINMGIAIACSHHERWDGTGYPEQLRGEDIPLSARIMAVADVYDALRTERPYKPAFSHAKSIRILNENSGTQFDPDIIPVFMEIEAEFDTIQKRLMDQ